MRKLSVSWLKPVMIVEVELNPNLEVGLVEYSPIDLSALSSWIIEGICVTFELR